MDELTGFQSRHLRHHLEQEGIRGDVERYAQETIGTALVHLQAQLSVRHVKLEEHVARRQVHVFQVRHVPCVDDNPPRVGIVITPPS